VFAPTLTDPQQAVGALKTTQSILRHIGICDGSLESGSMRCDVNISVGYPESNSTDRRRVRTEIKNLNSFESVRDASTFELNRHIELLESGSDILSETRYYDTFTKRTTRLRTKETSIDYRFLPEPDLPILHVTDEEIHEIQSCMPELPHETLLRLQREYDLSSDQIELLISKQAITYFENVCDYYSSKRNQDNLECRDHDIKTIYNWMMSELLGHLNALNLNFQNCPVMPTQLCDTVLLYLDKKISAPSAKRLTAELFDLNDPKKTAEQFASDLNIFQVNDDSHIEQICYQVLNDEKNRKKLDELLRGNSNILQFFMGGIMRSCQNKVDPKDVKRILQKVVDEMTSK
jgi:aspartyl-tRNA(Asn)/glutamyl-tRNA(Gln) amidotransferase subunit B